MTRELDCIERLGTLALMPPTKINSLVEALYKDALADLRQRAEIEARRDRALEQKFEFQHSAYPEAGHHILVWRKGGRFSQFDGAGKDYHSALLAALDKLGPSCK